MSLVIEGQPHVDPADLKLERRLMQLPLGRFSQAA